MGISSQGLVRVDMFKPGDVTAPKLIEEKGDAGDVVISGMTEPDEAAIPEILAYDNSPGQTTKSKLPRQHQRSKQRAAASSDDDTANTSRSQVAKDHRTKPNSNQFVYYP